jgi:hypothetical protein
MNLSGFHNLLFGKLHSDFIFLTLLDLIAHISMGIVTVQTVIISRIIYKCTKKLSQKHCFYFKNQGYLLVKEFSWQDPEQNSNGSGFQVEVDGFFDRKNMEKMGISVDSCVYVTSLKDFSVYEDNVVKCVNHRLNDFIAECDLEKQLRTRQQVGLASQYI